MEATKNNMEVPDKFKDLVETVEKMNVMELAELVKVLETKFGVSAAPTLAVGAPTSPEASVGEEKSTFDVELKEAGAQKIAVIKMVREVTGVGLKEAKDLVDGAPKIVKTGLAKAEAEEMKSKLEVAGAKAEVK